jgi:peroxiredoxin
MIAGGFFIAALLGVFTGTAQAQGMIPGVGAPSTSTTTAAGKTLFIGQKLPETLTVYDSSGTRRTVLSFKAPLEVLVIAFFSPRCQTDAALRADWRRFYESYKEWRVAFLAVSANQGESAAALASWLKEAGMPMHVVRDEDGAVTRTLGATATPQLLIVDEGGYLKYRGPLHDAGEKPGSKPKNAYGRKAIEAVIGHVEGVPYPEPAGFIGCAIQ